MNEDDRTPGGEPDDRLLAVAREAARAAADVHRQARGTIAVAAWSEKGRSDFVTEVDLEAERAIIGLLRESFPHHDVLAEEGTELAGTAHPQPVRRGAARVRWIIDPLDGTTNWLHGYPEYAVSLAAEDAGGLRVAVVLNSANGELFEASRGGGSRRDGEPVRVSQLRDLRLALVGTGFPFKKLEALPAYLDVFGRVLRGTSGIRRGGAAAIDLCNLACGRLDAFWEYWLMPWDVAAGALIVREAGGLFEPLPVPEVDSGEQTIQAPAGLAPGGFLASNPYLADAFRALVRRSR